MNNYTERIMEKYELTGSKINQANRLSYIQKKQNSQKRQLIIAGIIVAIYLAIALIR